jgi:hypothetical protein
MISKEDMQKFAISMFKYKLGGAEASGHFMDLSCEGEDWWFYEEYTDGFVDCYPVTREDVQSDLDNPEYNYGVLII